MRHSVLGWVLFGAACIQGQEQITVRIPAGARSANLIVKVPQTPAAGDRIVVSYSSSRMTATLVTPDGLKVSGDSPSRISPPFGSTDGGSVVSMEFRGGWKAGNYTVTIASPGLPAASTATAFYRSARAERGVLGQVLQGVTALAAPRGPEFRLFGLPNDSFVGDPLKVDFELRRGSISGPVQFEAAIETRPNLRVGSYEEYLNSGTPVVNPAPISLTKGADGHYRGTVTPVKPGRVRVQVKARGTDSAGRAFTSEDVSSEVLVNPVMATFVSYGDHAVDTDRNQRPDRLDIDVLLNVARAGKYEARLVMARPDGTGFLVHHEAVLAVGRQTLKVPIPAADLFANLGDGPYRSSQIWIQSDWIRVKGAPETFTTATAYRRDAWDRGKLYGDESVRVKPILPASSGKFRALEIEWTASTKGGDCSWSGQAAWKNRAASLSNSETESYHHQGRVPAGRHSFTFILNAQRFADPRASRGVFSGTVQCGEDSFVEERADFTLDPSKLEPGKSPLLVYALNPILTVTGRDQITNETHLLIDDANPRTSQFRVLDAPAGVKASVRVERLTGPQGDVFVYHHLGATAAAGMKPGRYFIAVEGTAKGMSETTIVALDVLAPIVPPPPDPSRKYESGPLTVKAINPDAAGKFRHLEISWPVVTPGGNCRWGGRVVRGGQEDFAGTYTGITGTLPKGQSTPSFALSTSIVADNGAADWTIRAYASCPAPNKPPGYEEAVAATEEKVELSPAEYAKSGATRPESTSTIRVRAGAIGITAIYTVGDKNYQAVYRPVEIPAGLQANVIRQKVDTMVNTQLHVAVGADVKPGRYFLGYTVTLGAKQGRGDVVVEVIP